MNIETKTAPNTTETAIGFIPCYRLPFLSLFHADCMEIMKQYPDKYFDLAIVDPPYGIGEHGGKFRGRKKDNYRKIVVHENKGWDKNIPPYEYWEQLFRVSKNQMVWGGNYFTENLPASMGWIFWDKLIGGDFSDGEFVWTSFQKAVRKFVYSYHGDTKGGHTRIHPTQKPIAVYEYCFNYANITEGMKILDTHFGSGSIALAVDKANRLDKMNLHLTACEIDKEYIDKAIKRISESVKQGTLSF